MRILLDISRTIARARLPAPTGIDRVERAYIDWALAQGALFVAGFDRRQYLIGPETVARLTTWLDASGPAPPPDLRSLLNPRRDPRLRRAQALIRREALAVADKAGLPDLLRDAGAPPGVYLNTGHDNLDETLMAALAQAGWRRVVMLHDVIPLDFPHFARAGTEGRFRARFRVACTADHLLFNSHDTADRAAAQAGHRLDGTVIPLGIETPPPPADPARGTNTFLILGTIEPRKNHALLLRIWAQLWQEQGAAAPRLTILGRRGWENDAVFRVLDTSPMMGRIVHESGPVDDSELTRLLAGCRALLFPSHAEGYGLPLAEALAAGVPVIAADLPALREVGGAVPDWLAPDDQTGWTAAIRDYATDPAPRRAAQLDRLTGWQVPTWQAHFDRLGKVLETIVVQAVREG